MMKGTRTPVGMTLAAIIAGVSCSLVAPAVLTPTAVHAAIADPTAEEVMQAAVKALGGREAIEKIKTLHVAMNMDMQGMAIKMESLWTRDGKQMAKTSTPMGDMVMANNGTVAWMKGPGGYVLLPEDQKKNLKDQSSVFMRILDPGTHMKESLETIENTGKATFADKECWKLHYKDSDGEEGDVYFEVDSGMPVGFESTEEQDGMKIKSKGIMSDWKEEQGVKFFRTMTMTSDAQQGMTVVMKVDSIEINTLKDDAFATPKEVEELTKNAPKPGEPEKEIKLEDMTPEQQETARQALEGMKRSGDVNAMKQMVQRLEPMIGMMPPNEQLPIKYAIQELKKEIAKQGG